MSNCPKLVSDYGNPAIKWHQTDLTVVICIQLTDVSDYYLRVENDSLQFSTETSEGKKYYLVLQLFGSVVAEKTVHKNVGREIRIYLVKGLKWYPWLRLIKSKEKNLFILYNPDHIRETENCEKLINISRFEKYRNKMQPIMPVVPSSDEEESEDEDYMNFLHYA